MEEQDEYVEVPVEDACPHCGGDLVLIANGQRPEIDLNCSCGSVAALC